MTKFYPPEKLVLTFYPEPQLIAWDFEKLSRRYYARQSMRTEENVRRAWAEENLAIGRSHERKLAAIGKVVQRCKKARCLIVTEDLGDGMRRVTVTK